jgi:glycosyltransferase involved in cell wall biosynthesis
LGLVRAGIDVTVYAEGTQAAFDFHGVTVQPVPRYALGPAATIGYDLQCLWHARRDFDVVYMLGYGAAWGCWLPRCWGTQVWINMDGLEWARSKWHPVARWYLRAMEACMARVANRVLADAQAIQTYYEQRYPHGAPATFIPYGAHVPEHLLPHPLSVALHRWGLVPDAYFLIVARMEPENHITDIIEGHQAWAGPLPLVIVGDHQAQNAYCRRLRGWASPTVRFLGPVYDAQTLSALRQGALAYIHGHSVGGTNPSLLEAMACANLVIAHDNPFNREVLGDDALYFQHSASLAAQCQQVVTLPHTQRTQHRQAMLTRVRTHYTWEAVVQQYLDLIPHKARS